jgi:hypothetical protein
MALAEAESPRRGVGEASGSLASTVVWSAAGVGDAAESVKHVLRVVPKWILNDRKVLRCFAFFKEGVVESPIENFRCRRCVIRHYLEDETTEICEEKVRRRVAIGRPVVPLP